MRYEFSEVQVVSIATQVSAAIVGALAPTSFPYGRKLCVNMRCYRTRYPATYGRILQAHFDSHTETQTQVT